jgi:hypothetical protein
LEYHKTILSQIQERFKLSEYQKKFYLAITVLQDNIIDSHLEDLLSSKNEINSDSNQESLSDEILEGNLERHLKKIILNSEIVEELIDEFLLNKNWKQNIKNYFMNDMFSSIYHFRVELLMKYNVEEFMVESDKGHFIDV